MHSLDPQPQAGPSLQPGDEEHTPATEINEGIEENSGGAGASGEKPGDESGGKEGSNGSGGKEDDSSGGGGEGKDGGKAQGSDNEEGDQSDPGSDTDANSILLPFRLPSILTHSVFSIPFCTSVYVQLKFSLAIYILTYQSCKKILPLFDESNVSNFQNIGIVTRY